MIAENWYAFTTTAKLLFVKVRHCMTRANVAILDARLDCRN